MPSTTFGDREALVKVDDRLFSGRIWREGERPNLLSLRATTEESAQAGIPLEELRQVLPGSFGPKLAEAILQELASQGTLVHQKGAQRLSPAFDPPFPRDRNPSEAELRKPSPRPALPPRASKELGETLGWEPKSRQSFASWKDEGEVVSLDGGVFLRYRGQSRRAGDSVVTSLGGKKTWARPTSGRYSPSARRHLLPLLRYFDLVGVTTRMGDGRSVAERAP